MTGSVITEKPEETIDLGRLFASCLRPGDIVALRGELGTGKTCFTKGIGRGLQVPERYVISSPSFTIVNEYPGRVPLYHLDVYRFSGGDELMGIGYEEYFFGPGVTVIEWADKVMNLISPDAFVIDFFYMDDKRRHIFLSGPDDRMKTIKKVIEDGGFSWL